MINYFLINIFLLFTHAIEPSFVKEFHALKEKKMEQQFIEKYQYSTNKSVQAYVVAVKMKKAEYTWNPLKKVSIFKKQKKVLNQLIIDDPNNLHLRYVRLLLQEKTPRILGYNSNITEDKEKIKYWIQKKDSIDYLDKYIKQNTSI